MDKQVLRDTIKEVMDEVICEVVDKKIKEHEIRVGWISGIIGVFFVFGIVHSIWLIKSWIL
jgi:hypothetical protein